MAYLKSVGSAVIYISLFLAIITFLPGIPPEAEYSEQNIVIPGDVKQPFELKNRLKGAEVLFKGELKGPESFDTYAGELYTGIHGGYVVKIEQDHLVPITKFGKKCEGIWQEDKCGRPLGLKFNDKGDMYVVDAYYGIFSVNVGTGNLQHFVNISEPIEGKIPMLPNSIDIAKNGDFYWTDSSTEFHLYDGVYTGLTDPSGRLIRYNAATKKNEVLLDKLHFANGLKLSEDESFIIVLETFKSRIIKYYLKGPKAGQHEIFVEGLPGLPDNVHSDGGNGFLVSLITYVDADHPMLFQSFMPLPNIRKLLSRLMYLMEAPLKLLHEVYPNAYAERFTHSIGSFEPFQGLDTAKKSIVLRIDGNGKVLDALYSDDGTVNMISSAIIHGDYLWLGSPFAERLLRVPLKQAFPDLAETRKHTVHIREKRSVEEPAIKSETRKDQAKPSKQAAKTSVPETTAKATTTSTTSKPATQPSQATQKPTTTTTTPKPVTQKPITTTTEKSVPTTPKPTTSTPRAAKPVTEREPPKRGNTVSTTPKPSTTSTPPPPKPVQKPAQKPVQKPTQKPAEKAPEKKTDVPKTTSSTKAKAQINKSNSQSKESHNSKKTEEKPKHSKPIEQKPQNTGSEKTTEKNRPKDSKDSTNKK